MLLKNVHWSLGQKKFENYEDFIAAVTQYNQEIAPGKHKWDPNEQVAPGPITVVYEALWKDEDDMLELGIGQPASPLLMGTLLFVLNNESYTFFQDADKHFFEGLSAKSGSTFYLEMGS